MCHNQYFVCFWFIKSYKIAMFIFIYFTTFCWSICALDAAPKQRILFLFLERNDTKMKWQANKTGVFHAALTAPWPWLKLWWADGYHDIHVDFHATVFASVLVLWWAYHWTFPCCKQVCYLSFKNISCLLYKKLLLSLKLLSIIQYICFVCFSVCVEGGCVH